MSLSEDREDARGRRSKKRSRDNARVEDPGKRAKACIACRRAKLKCHQDEGQPDCERCRTRGEGCDWSQKQHVGNRDGRGRCRADVARMRGGRNWSKATSRNSSRKSVTSPRWWRTCRNVLLRVITANVRSQRRGVRLRPPRARKVRAVSHGRPHQPCSTKSSPRASSTCSAPPWA
jgi:hypothetical protein